MKKNNGFTMIELLISIALISIIAILALPALRNFQSKNIEKTYVTLRNSLINAARLYTDSSSEDMFGSSDSGCVMLTYDQLKSKDLLKKFEHDGVTCSTFSTVDIDGINKPFIDSWTYYGGNDPGDNFCLDLPSFSKSGDICPKYSYGVDGSPYNQSFVRVYKVKNYYHYQYAIDCYKGNKKVYSENTIQGECLNVEDHVPPTILFDKNGTDDKFYQNFKTVLKVYDQSTLSHTLSIKYAWITTGDTKSSVVDPYIKTIDREANISFASNDDNNEVNNIIRNQLINSDGSEKEIIWNTKTFKVKKNGTIAKAVIETPKNRTGSYYLVVKPFYGEDGFHNSWKGFGYTDSSNNGGYYWISKPVLLDNTPPQIKDSDVEMVRLDCKEKSNSYNADTAHGKCTSSSYNSTFSNDSWTNRIVKTSVGSSEDGFSGLGYYTYKTRGATKKHEYCELDDLDCHDDNYLDLTKIRGLDNDSNLYIESIVNPNDRLSRKIEAEGVSYITYKVCDNTITSDKYDSYPNCTEYKEKTIKTDYTAPTYDLTYELYNNTGCAGTKISANSWTRYGSVKASGSQDKFGGNSNLDANYKKTSGFYSNLNNNYQYIYKGSSDVGTKVTRTIEHDGVGQCSNINEENKTTEKFTNVIYSVCDTVHNCSNYVSDSVSIEKTKLNIDRTAPKDMRVVYLETGDRFAKTSPSNLSVKYESGDWRNVYVFTQADSSYDYVHGDVKGGVNKLRYEYIITGVNASSKESDYFNTGEGKLYVNITKQGISTIKYRVCDKLNNCSDYSSIYTVKLDFEVPSCSATSYGWKNTASGSSTVTCTDTGGSGCNGDYSLYKDKTNINTGSVIDDKKKKRSNTQSVSDEGIHTLKWKTWDDAENSRDCSATIKLDRSPPTCGTIHIPAPNGNNGWYRSPISISRTSGVDQPGLSGVSSSVLSHNSIGSNTSGTTISLTTTDVAGNSTTCTSNDSGSNPVMMDITKPICTSSSDNTSWTNSDVSIHGKCSDNLSGCPVEQIDKLIGSQGPNDTSPGTIYDTAGNSAVCPAVRTQIDKTPPSCSISGGGDWSPGGATITISCSKNDPYSPITCNGQGSHTVTSSVTSTVTDSAGNSGSCSYNVSSATQYRSATRTCDSCYYGSPCGYTERVQTGSNAFKVCGSTSCGSSECAIGASFSEGDSVCYMCDCPIYEDLCVNTCRYGCSNWSDWSDWGFSGNCSSETCKSESRTVYR